MRAEFTRIVYLSVLCGMLFSLVPLPAMAAADSTVHGNVYDWSTFNTVSTAVVEVYSMPDHTFIARNVTRPGSYLFNLPAGSYQICAKTGTQGMAGELVASDNLTIKESGDYNIDLILFPPTRLEDLELLNESASENQAVETGNTGVAATSSPLPTQASQQSQSNYGSLAVIGIAGIAAMAALTVLVIAVIYRARRGQTKTVALTEIPTVAEPEPPAMQEPESSEAPEIVPEPAESPPHAETMHASPNLAQEQHLPQDCRDVIAIIEKSGGRITQLDLRKKLPYSEAKVSLIVSDLESRGIVKKIKKGRGNIIILQRPGEQPPEK